MHRQKEQNVSKTLKLERYEKDEFSKVCSCFSYNFCCNAQEVNGLKVAETVYKKDGNMLTNYMKYNYKYNDNNQMTENMSQKWNVNKNCWENDLCIRYTYDNKSVTTEYYKWNSKKNDFILIPEMTVTMDK